MSLYSGPLFGVEWRSVLKGPYFTRTQEAMTATRDRGWLMGDGLRCGLNVCASRPHLYIEIITPSVMVSGGALGEVLRS